MAAYLVFVSSVLHRGDRYDALRACIGDSLCQKLHDLNVFLVSMSDHCPYCKCFADPANTAHCIQRNKSSPDHVCHCRVNGPQLKWDLSLGFALTFLTLKVSFSSGWLWSHRL